MDQYIDIRDVDKCPDCGGHNTTTSEICLFCSIKKRCKEKPNFKRQIVETIGQLKAILKT